MLHLELLLAMELLPAMGLLLLQVRTMSKRNFNHMKQRLKDNPTELLEPVRVSVPD